MPYLIRNTAGEICGLCTNRPGEGNLLPDGEPEVVELYENETPEIAAFLAAQEAKLGKPPADRLQTVIDYIAQKADAPADLRAMATKE